MSYLVVIAIWGVPIYLVDRRARRNQCSPGKRLLIAILMTGWSTIIPLLIALPLAGPGHPETKRHRSPSWRGVGGPSARTAYADYHDPYDPWTERQHRHEQEEREAQKQQQHRAWTEAHERTYNSDDPDD